MTFGVFLAATSGDRGTAARNSGVRLAIMKNVHVSSVSVEVTKSCVQTGAVGPPSAVTHNTNECHKMSL